MPKTRRIEFVELVALFVLVVALGMILAAVTA